MISMLLPLVAAAPNVWTLAVGGDIMLNGINPSSKPFQGIAIELRSADVAIGNLEIPLTSASRQTRQKSLADRRAKRQFVLKGSPLHGPDLGYAGFDLMSLGNNHIMDFGWEGAAETASILDGLRIGWAGIGETEQLAARPKRYRGARTPPLALVSFLSFMSDGANRACSPAEPDAAGVATLRLGGQVGPMAKARIAEIVKGCRTETNFVVVALHWGIERQEVPTPYQVALARAFVDAGADAVLGHHPHVLQGAELYRGKPIFYSLGNLVSTMGYPSAIFQARFQGERWLRTRMVPIVMPGGRPRPIEGTSARSELDRWNALGRKLLATFPSAASVPMSASL